MQLGMVGLGRMGANLVRRLMRAGHECVVYDVSADAVRSLVDEGATGAASLEEFVQKLSVPRAAWVMVPPPSMATCIAVRPAPGTSSRWSTTASSTARWPPTPRG